VVLRLLPRNAVLLGKAVPPKALASSASASKARERSGVRGGVRSEYALAADALPVGALPTDAPPGLEGVAMLRYAVGVDVPDATAGDGGIDDGGRSDTAPLPSTNFSAVAIAATFNPMY
jgi:hypothetical protein